MSLLRQDVRLPENSVHDFGRDLIVALQHLHSKEIIYCDLKPSNILLDENGRLKLGGFGLSRRLSDINKKPIQALTPVCVSPRRHVTKPHGTSTNGHLVLDAYVCTQCQHVACACRPFCPDLPGLYRSIMPRLAVSMPLPT